MGFEELSPNKIVTELFGNLKSGDKVAIVSRKVSDKQPLQNVVNALTMRGLSVRVINHNKHNFCFMMKTQKE